MVTVLLVTSPLPILTELTINFLPCSYYTQADLLKAPVPWLYNWVPDTETAVGRTVRLQRSTLQHSRARFSSVAIEIRSEPQSCAFDGRGDCWVHGNDRECSG